MVNGDAAADDDDAGDDVWNVDAAISCQAMPCRAFAFAYDMA